MTTQSAAIFGEIPQYPRTVVKKIDYVDFQRMANQYTKSGAFVMDGEAHTDVDILIDIWLDINKNKVYKEEEICAFNPPY